MQKIIGYHFKIEYKPAHENSAADSLSRLHEDDSGVEEAGTRRMAVLSCPKFSFLEVLHHENKDRPDFLAIHAMLQGSEGKTSGYSEQEEIIFYRGKYYLSKTSSLNDLMLQEFHEL